MSNRPNRPDWPDSPDSPVAARVRAREPAALDEVSSAPIRLRSDNLVERPWGGRRLLSYKRAGERPGRFGEAFELAADDSDPEAARHPSTVVFADGSTISLPELVRLAPRRVLGEASFAAFGARVPLLPKTLDVHGLLSVQTHPPGNPEVYVILDCEPGATLRLGFRAPVDPEALQRELTAGRRDQEALLALLRPDVDLDLLQAEIAPRLASSDELPALVEAVARHLREPSDRARIEQLLDRLATLYRRVLDRLNTVEVAPGQVIFNAFPPAAETGVTPSAEVHALGDPRGRSMLALEIRRPGPTFRAWDHLRFPMREVAIERAIATMNVDASDPDDFRVEPRPLAERPGVWRSIACPAFVVDHVRPAEGEAAEALAGGSFSTLHAVRGRVRLTGAGDWGELAAGESVLIPAGVEALSILGCTPDAEVVQVVLPMPTVDGRARNLADLRALAPASSGPRQVLAIVNGGDGPAVGQRLRAMARTIFRADGSTDVVAHEERTRRGQFLGLLDAHRAFVDGHGPLDPDGVALAIMLPGKGTRASPLTQRLHGIKPLLPMPMRVEGPDGPRWLDGATASLWSWTLVAHTLERAGFSGLACKWGDEPQIPAHALADFRGDLRGVDAVRFGARSRVTEDLARNKEWLHVDERTGDLIVQVHRRPRAQLVAWFGRDPSEAEVHAHVHTGSPAFSHRFLRHAHAVFGDVEGWLDVDGYLFEALTQDADAWAGEVERDAGLRAVLDGCPDFYARARELRRRIEAERGHPLRIAVIDLGEALYWGDIGQARKARDVYAILTAPGPEGAFARSLAGITDGPDRHGNWTAGDVQIPDDGRVRDSVILDSRVEGSAVEIEGAVVARSQLGDAVLAPGSVSVDARATSLILEAGAFAYASVAVGGAVGGFLRVPAQFVHTSIPADPRDPAGGLESWFADLRVDLGAEAHYAQPRWGNPTSLAAKFEQVRQRELSPAEVDAWIRASAGELG